MTALPQQLDIDLDTAAPHGPVRIEHLPASRSPRRQPIVNAGLVVKVAIGVIAFLIVLLAALGGIGSFSTLRHLAAPWFGSSAWIVPVGIDVGILALLAWDMLAEYLGFPAPLLRWTAWGFIGATVYLNVAAAHGNPTASVMHAAMPTLFVIVIEGIRHLIRQWAGIVAGTRIDPVPASRWFLAPISSFVLARRMKLWEITSYRHALALESQRLQTVARLQEDYGRYMWRWRAPLRDRLALRLAWAADATHLGSASTIDEASPAPVETAEPDTAADETGTAMEHLLAHLPQRCLIEPSKPAGRQASNRDQALIDAATAILRDADRQGTRLSQATLAKRLREKGHAIANERLRWLVSEINRWDGAQPAPSTRQGQAGGT